MNCAIYCTGFIGSWKHKCNTNISILYLLPPWFLVTLNSVLSWGNDHNKSSFCCCLLRGFVLFVQHVTSCTECTSFRIFWYIGYISNKSVCASYWEYKFVSIIIQTALQTLKVKTWTLALLLVVRKKSSSHVYPPSHFAEIWLTHFAIVFYLHQIQSCVKLNFLWSWTCNKIINQEITSSVTMSSGGLMPLCHCIMSDESKLCNKTNLQRKQNTELHILTLWIHLMNYIFLKHFDCFLYCSYIRMV